jgi:hypothetical protein
MKKWNHYICDKCDGVTIARHDDEGVTPFMIRCQVRDRVVAGIRIKGCNGNAASTFFGGPQDDDQVPHVIFFRPTDAPAVIDAINREPRRFRADLLEHYRLGGALMKRADGSAMGADG